MGNGLSPCMHLPATAAAGVKLVYWGGQTRMLDDDGGVCAVAGDVTAELPGDHVVCAADSFYVGLPIPVVSAGEELMAGRTYFVLPAERFSCFKVLTRRGARVAVAGAVEEGVRGWAGAVPVRVRQGRGRRHAHPSPPGVHREGDQLRRERRRCAPPEAVDDGDGDGDGAVQHAGAEAALRAADGAEEPAVVAEAGDDLGVQQD
ncbi:hypothetical protein OsJ_04786 [Oryza sativa Japonica Group]|uniref:Uncharacterized protein n=1 Tax=Oryza sativa subsp. japonica TaxID=39947 RepID=A3A1L1_ORYSJ|nr:hypothetical protein OsJ_04786 [Oryza sativa Japonica Group]